MICVRRFSLQDGRRAQPPSTMARREFLLAIGLGRRSCPGRNEALGWLARSRPENGSRSQHVLRNRIATERGRVIAVLVAQRDPVDALPEQHWPATARRTPRGSPTSWATPSRSSRQRRRSLLRPCPFLAASFGLPLQSLRSCALAGHAPWNLPGSSDTLSARPRRGPATPESSRLDRHLIRAVRRARPRSRPPPTRAGPRAARATPRADPRPRAAAARTNHRRRAATASRTRTRPRPGPRG